MAAHLANSSAILTNDTGIENVTVHNDYMAENISTLAIVKSIYYSLASVVALLGNGLALLVIFKRYALHKVSYYLVANLAVKDFAYAIFSSVLSVPNIIRGYWIFGHPLCVFFGFITTFLSYLELLTLVTLAMDRYVACVRPLRYHQIVTPKKFKMAVAFCWCYSILWAAMPLFGFSEYIYKEHLCICQLNWSPGLIQKAYIYSVGACLFYPGTGLVVFCYVKIHRSAAEVVDLTVFSVQTPGHLKTKTQQLTKNSKATFTIALITGIYFTCWIPFVAIRISQLYVTNFKEISGLQSFEDFTIYSFSIANFINPLIYAAYNKEFRYELRRFLRK